MYDDLFSADQAHGPEKKKKKKNFENLSGNILQKMFGIVWYIPKPQAHLIPGSQQFPPGMSPYGFLLAPSCDDERQAPSPMLIEELLRKPLAESNSVRCELEVLFEL